jgi:hypothetical protein
VENQKLKIEEVDEYKVSRDSMAARLKELWIIAKNMLLVFLMKKTVRTLI